MLVMIMFVGYLATVMKVFDKHANANFAALITYVTVPALVIASVEGAGACDRIGGRCRRGRYEVGHALRLVDRYPDVSFHGRIGQVQSETVPRG